MSQVENALEGREGLDVEIFGMEGIPEEALVEHNQQITEDFHKNRADRQAATGNPPPGANGNGAQGAPHKKLKMESAEELKARLATYRAQADARKTAAEAAAKQAAQAPQQPPSAQAAPLQFSGGLPQRPGATSGYGASTLDDLVSGASASASSGFLPAQPSQDEIERVIRMAEAGIVRPAPDVSAAPPEKKKDKSTRMVYQDGDYSLEEKMAQMVRYAVAV